MKPAPAESLLAPGQVWTVVESDGWDVYTGPRLCVYREQNGTGTSCRLPAVALSPLGFVWSSRTLLCSIHINAHRWIGDDGRVWQWRADPPWTAHLSRQPLDRVRRPSGAMAQQKEAS